MQVRFNDEYLEKLYSNQTLKGKPVYSSEVIIQFKKTVLKIKQAENTIELRQQKGLHFEALKGNKKGLFSIRVNKQYRLEFKIENDIIKLVEIILIEHLSKHYRNIIMANYRVIGKNGEVLETNVTLHPGEVLADELEARNILKKDFAALIGLRPSHLSDLLKGKRHVSAKLALKLEQHLQINASFWLRVQMAYDLFMAKKELEIT